MVIGSNAFKGDQAKAVVPGHQHLECAHHVMGQALNFNGAVGGYSCRDPPVSWRRLGANAILLP